MFSRTVCTFSLLKSFERGTCSHSLLPPVDGPPARNSMLRLIETWGSPTMITGPMQDDFFQAATDQQLGREEGGGGGWFKGCIRSSLRRVICVHPSPISLVRWFFFHVPVGCRTRRTRIHGVDPHVDSFQAPIFTRRRHVSTDGPAVRSSRFLSRLRHRISAPPW